MANSARPDERVSFLGLLAELTYPEYRQRHIFTARLRILLFLGFLFFYVLALSDILPSNHPAVLVIIGAFVATIFCYYNIISGHWMIPSFILEVLADLTGITALLYILGGVSSEFYLFYLCYVLVCGLFYSYHAAALLALGCLGFYALLCWLTIAGIMPPLDVVHLGSHQAHVIAWSHPIEMHLVVLALLLGCVVYAIKIAQSFSWMRERSLEARNRELLALQNIGGMIRTTASLREVADQVLHGLMGGLDLTGCLLFLRDPRNESLVCYPPKKWSGRKALEVRLQIDLQDLTLAIANTQNVLFQQVMERKVAFRQNLEELFIGMQPAPAKEQVRRAQEELGLRKIVAIPLIAEEELLGALVGLSSESFVGERAVSTLEIFANQAALVLRVTLLIEQLKQANRDLLEANRVKSEFLATMSHELRTPLTAIIGFSELLVEGAMGTMNDEQSDSLKEILNNGANLLEMINNILDLARMESGRMTLTIERFDLRDLLERTHRTLGSLVARKQQSLSLALPERLPPIEADERRIQQVLLNLLGNAIKFTPDGGSIAIKAEHFAKLERLKGILWREHFVDPLPFAQGGFVLQVADTGIGIPQQQLETIFEMFKQVDSSVTRRYEGTGLGLALVRQLVEMHRGIIWAESAEGAGTTFTCLLPISHPERKTLPIKAPQEVKAPAVSTVRVPV